MIDGSVLQSAQRCFEKKSRVVVKMVVNLIFIIQLVECLHRCNVGMISDTKVKFSQSQVFK